MPITALYAALLAPLLIWLSVRVIAMRRQARVAIGHGEDKDLLRRMRVHANFTEYTPFALLLLALAEGLAPPAMLLHAIGFALLAGRYVHALGVSKSPENFNLRVTGMSLTFAAIAVAGLTCLVFAAGRLFG